jgi:hypothetical protein
MNSAAIIAMLNPEIPAMVRTPSLALQQERRDTE